MEDIDVSPVDDTTTDVDGDTFGQQTVWVEGPDN